MLSRIEGLRSPALASRARKNPLKVLIALNATWRQRKTLTELEAHMLRDLGITQSEAQNEANRPFWDVPTNWTR